MCPQLAQLILAPTNSLMITYEALVIKKPNLVTSSQVSQQESYHPKDIHSFEEHTRICSLFQSSLNLTQEGMLGGRSQCPEPRNLFTPTQLATRLNKPYYDRLIPLHHLGSRLEDFQVSLES